MKEVTRDTYLDWYKNMMFWRKFEDKLASVYIQQKVRGFLHLYNGQEAILAGSLHAMDLTEKFGHHSFGINAHANGLNVITVGGNHAIFGKVHSV